LVCPHKQHEVSGAESRAQLANEARITQKMANKMVQVSKWLVLLVLW